MAPYVSVACDDGPIFTCPECHTAGGGRRADAKFTSAARTDVPALAAEVRRLRGELIEQGDRLRETLAKRDELRERLELAEEAASRLRALLDLPAGIRWDLTRWRCDRCGTTSEWTGDTDPAAVDPVTAAADEAHRHAADHQRWDAEREVRRQVRQATPPAGTGGERDA